MGSDLVCRQGSVSEGVIFFSQDLKDKYGKGRRRDRGRSYITDGLAGKGTVLD